MSSTEKKSKEAQLNRTSHKFQTNDVVLAKVRGFPAWPGIVMDDANVPQAVLKERPQIKHRDLYTIRFFPAADYHWAFSKDLELLGKDKIDAFLAGPNRKKGDLRQAYELARDPHSWNEEQNTVVRNYEQSLQDAADEEEENQDQLEEEDEDDEEVSSKKRKRAPETGKVRESADKRNKKSKVAEAAAKPKSEKPASKAAAAAAANGDDKEEHLDPETKKVKEWRHKVQKVFLGKEGTIHADDMPGADATFKTVEEYDGMTAEHLRTTKIGKVMKRVMQLSDIPRDDEFHFKERAEKLCAKWGAIMAGGDAAPKEEGASGEVKENGDAAAHAEPTEPKSEPEAAAAPPAAEAPAESA
ncbi:PWWP domain protein [Kalmanozyma brasiliensis GHG001]|uniref:PWWP domain-containing protein n=1 Tax=Kalmanozyma brasiliensis (strain GHG001) TaxID=1365824 RepID=V5EXY2_KALBG|nr:PWWP domain protein [Kalmanozyma brasiliensis GHG001]EST08478.1 PWWP domain protein [Kalmanozyma brasiliensis GHG001]